MQSQLNLAVWQTYFSQEGFIALDKGFIPYSNRGMESLYFENEVILDVHKNHRNTWERSDYVGILSWRMAEKTKLNSEYIHDSIVWNPRKDVYSLTPDMYKNNPSPFSVTGFGHVFPICKLMDRDGLFPFKTAGYSSRGRYKNFCNYFLCTPAIFDDYVGNYLSKLYDWMQSSKDKELQDLLKRMVMHRNSLYPIHPFVMEGLFECYMNYAGHSYDYIKIDEPKKDDVKLEYAIIKKALNS